MATRKIAGANTASAKTVKAAGAAPRKAAAKTAATKVPAAKKAAAKKAPAQASAAKKPKVTAPAKQNAAAKTPAVKASAAKTPAAKTPAAKTPAAKTPAAKTPARKTPRAKPTHNPPHDTPTTARATRSTTAGEIRIGIGGWTFEPWRGVFYPEGLTQKRELEYASRQLTSIEINGTFYGSQKPESFAKWHDETPDDFVFALKAPRFATHRRVLAQAGESIERFVASGILELRDKLGPINWQFAPTKQFDAQDFDAFLALLPQHAGGRALRHAVEVRHESFRNPEFVALARKHGVAIVMAGDSKYLQIADVSAPFVYARIMGTSDAHKQGYDDAALDRWSAHAQTWAAGGTPAGLETVAETEAPHAARDVFLYVISGHKVHNPAAGMALIERLKP